MRQHATEQTDEQDLNSQNIQDKEATQHGCVSDKETEAQRQKGNVFEVN